MLFCGLWCLCASYVASAQTQKLRWNSKLVITTADSLTILPSSIQLQTGTATWQFVALTNTLVVKPLSDTGSLTYQVLPISLHSRQQKIIAPKDSLFYSYLPPVVPLATSQVKEQLFATPNIQKSGSLTRGISVGNVQNLAVNSALNLQMEGQLTQDLRLTALITDQSIPFQPEGNTAQLRELDRVLVQLDHKYGSLQAGDVVLQSQVSESPFLRYYKNVQGAKVLTQFGEKGKQTQVEAGVALAKGRFNSTIIQAIDGLQGPYRLPGPNGEAFIIVLANSERVFVDGRLLKRGFEYDYTIDYNLGEIAFTPEVIITRYSRIRVDYEFSERNYSRTSVMAGVRQQFQDGSAYVRHYREEDNAERPISFTLDSATRSQLVRIGDTLVKAVVSGVTRVTEFSQDRVLYRRVDTLGEVAYVYISSARTEMYQVFFTDVGAGQGAYELQTTAGNGRIYRWVGQGRGRFAPIRRLVTPDQKAMTAAGINFDLNAHEQLQVDLAISQRNVNCFAPSAAQNGLASSMTWRSSGRKLVGDYTMASSVTWERLERQFAAVDRFRPIEFDRNWNASVGDTLNAEDNYVKGQWRMENKRGDLVYTQLERRAKGQNVDGWRYEAGVSQQLGKYFKTRHNGYWQSNQRQEVNALWRKYQGLISADVKGLSLSYDIDVEQNRINAGRGDSTLATSMHYLQHQVTLGKLDSLQGGWQVGGLYRSDQLPFAGAILDATHARQLFGRWGGRLNPQTTTNLTMTYRQLSAADGRVSPIQETEENITGRLDLAGEYLSRHIRTELVFQGNSGREAQREYRFTRVLITGEGTHQWIDGNNDGIQQLDEFVESQRPEDRQFVKLLVPTNQFIKAFSQGLNFRLDLQGPRSWRERTGIARLVSRLSSLTGWNLDRRFTGNSLADRLNPFTTMSESELVSVNQTLRSSLFYNRSSPSYGAELAYSNNRQRQLLTIGFDERLLQSVKFSWRQNIQQFVNATVNLESAARIARSDALAQRNFHIQVSELNPVLAWQPQGSFRLEAQYAYTQRLNLNDRAQATINKAQLEARLNQLNNRTATAAIRMFLIAYRGEGGQSPVSYELLEALQPGTNLTWSLNLQQRLANGLQLLVNYEGRQSPGLPLVHLGRVQVTALF